MTRVALYARYSTDNQPRPRSKTKFRICREEAKREKWKIVGAYRNAGISGRVHYGVPGPGSAQLHRCSCRQSFSRHWALPQTSCSAGDGVGNMRARKSSTLAQRYISRLRTLNNLIEQDHRGVKQRIATMLGFKGFATAAIIAGIELMHRIRKGQFGLGRLGVQGRLAPAVWNAVLQSLKSRRHNTGRFPALAICARAVRSSRVLLSNQLRF